MRRRVLVGGAPSWHLEAVGTANKQLDTAVRRTGVLFVRWITERPDERSSITVGDDLEALRLETAGEERYFYVAAAFAGEDVARVARSLQTAVGFNADLKGCLLYTSPSPRD